MGSILTSMEDHFEPMSCEYCIEKGWTHIGLYTYEKVVTVPMLFKYYPHWDDRRRWMPMQPGQHTHCIYRHWQGL